MTEEFHLYTESPVEAYSYSIAEDWFIRLNVSHHKQMSSNNRQMKC